jgi:hypothetical protein
MCKTCRVNSETSVWNVTGHSHKVIKSWQKIELVRLWLNIKLNIESKIYKFCDNGILIQLLYHSVFYLKIQRKVCTGRRRQSSLWNNVIIKKQDSG